MPQSLAITHPSSPPQPSAAPALLIAGAVSLLALPSAVLAFSSRLDLQTTGLSVNSPANQGLGKFAPGQLDPHLARAMAAGAVPENPLFRFTPAGLTNRPDRSVTVAVRVDSATAHEIIVLGNYTATPSGSIQVANALPTLRIAPSAYNLGMARGYHGFAQNTPTAGLSSAIRKIEMPDLSAYKSEDTSTDTPSRLAARIALDERERAGRAPRTVDAYGTQTVDLGGSYRLSRNLNVTAGVRYSRDGDRIRPLTDGKADSQSVFVGTQFRF
ncbi:MAG: hypothetical protein RLY97_1701 [Pseudomonadota bacterium]|jgi:hypothetical protein